ncbi:MAG: EAL domain-containing protein [Nitrosomonas sp.]|nr:EAL domain-containing protein [Nitrosomonas sp.]
MVPRNPKLLIIDDCEIDSKSLYINLAKYWKKLIYKRISSISEFQAALYDSSWDAVIAEYSLPQFDALNALDLLKRSGKEIPFFIYSKNTDENNALAAMRHGACDYLHKGFSFRLVFALERELKLIDLKRKQRQTESQFFHLAYYDELTGLPKYKLFCEKASEVLSNRSAQGKIAAIYSIKIEHLPTVGNSRGYNIADALIKQFVYRLSVHTGRNCLLTRLEGGRFTFLNGEVNTLDEVQVFANQILKLGSLPFMIENLEFYISLNIGITIYPDDGSDIEVLLTNSESTLAVNKGSWKNSYQFYTKEVSEISLQRTFLSASLRRALEKNEFVLYYQPIIDVKIGRITGVETLVRWDNPEFGLLQPDKFIPLADETSLIVDIGKWVLQEACKQARYWQDAGGEPISIAVNTSAIELGQSHYLNYITEVLKKERFDPALLELEITESVLMHDTDTSIKVLRELKQMGIKIAIDNFGIGFTSLNCLKKYPIDILKMDRSLTNDMTTSADSLSIVNAIVGLAKNLGVLVLAKGIETREQLDLLTKMNCNKVQGFIFSEPVTGEKLLSFIKLRKTGTFT